MRAFRLDDERLLRFHDFEGSGRPLLFIHGLGCASSCDYPRVAIEPALEGRRMLLVDLLGFGFSDRPTDFGYSVEAHAEALATMLDGLGLPAVDLYGHSMGGAIAIALAALRPDRVSHLVLCEPNLVSGGGFFSRPIAAQAEADYLTWGHADAVATARSKGNDIWAGSLSISSPLAVHRGAVSLVRGGTPSWLELLAALQLPRAAIYGARSLPDLDATRLEGLGVPVHMVADAGHSVAWENPRGLARAIATALG